MKFSLPVLLLPVFSCLSVSAAPQPILTCVTGAVPLTVRAEGVTERTGDVLLNCSGGAPSAMVTGNFSLFLNVAITNRITAANATDVLFTYDDGAGPQPVATPGILSGAVVSFNGATFPLSASGGVNLRFSNIRANATEVKAGATIYASLALNSGNILPLTQSVFAVATPMAGLFTGSSGKLVCSQRGSPLPAAVTSFAALLAAQTVFTTTRLTEGFASAFEPLSNQTNFNGNSGERFIVTYSGFSAGAQLFVPNVVAGSDAVKPTAGGDLGAAASGGQYQPSASGSLLLALVPYADSTGAGGTPIYTPAAPGAPVVDFDATSAVPMTNGAGYAVYEVVDANAFSVESAQFPTFLGLAPNAVSTGAVIETTESVTFAPVSSVAIASATAPVPRFAPLTPGADCSIVGDCGASYYPKVAVIPATLSFKAMAGGKLQSNYIHVGNAAGGVLNWTATIEYAVGGPSGWLQVSPDAGIGATNTYAYFDPSQLSPGTYQATIVLSAGIIGGQANIPVTGSVAAAQGPPAPGISGVTSAADFHLTTLAPGSLATIFGAHFTGKQVAALFNGLAGTIFFSNDSQVNLEVPAALAAQASAQLIVTVDGQSSVGVNVKLAPFAPAIFAGGVLNQDGTVNSASNPARGGTEMQIFATGLSGSGTITAKLTVGGTETDAPIDYSGPAPGLTGVQQVNLTVPVTGPSVQYALALCGASGSVAPVCSAAVPVYTTPPPGIF